MRGTTSRRMGFADRGRGSTSLVVALALAVTACGAPDEPEVDDDPPSDAQPADEDDPTDGDPTDPDPVDGEPSDDDPTDPEVAEDAAPGDEGSDDTDGATEDIEVAAACDDLEGRPYDPPAEEQPAADPDVTSAEAVPDIEPLDDEEWNDEWDDGPPPTPMDRARFWAEQEAPEHLGGVWLDQDEGGVSVIGFTEDVETYAEEVRSRFSEHLWVVRSDNAFQDLEALQEEIDQGEAAEDWYDEDGHPRHGAIVMQGLRTSISRVTLMLLEPDDDRLRQLSERYGADRICFEIMGAASEEEEEG
jgi:hypothetical protein